MLNAGVMTLRPDSSFLKYLHAVAVRAPLSFGASCRLRGDGSIPGTLGALCGGKEKASGRPFFQGSFPTFQQFLDIFLLEVFQSPFWELLAGHGSPWLCCLG